MARQMQAFLLEKFLAKIWQQLIQASVKLEEKEKAVIERDTEDCFLAVIMERIFKP